MNRKKENSNPQDKFEDILTRLEEIVEKLESGGIGLEESMKLHEEGISKADVLNTMLADAREKVMKLVVREGESSVEKFEPEENA